MANSEKSERQRNVFHTGLLGDLTVQDAVTIIALHAARLDPEGCQEEVDRITVLLNDDSLFDEKSSDTLRRVNQFVNAMKEVNSLDAVETAAQSLTPELQQKAFMLAARVGKSTQDSRIEAVKILESLAAKLSIDSKIVHKTIGSVISDFLDKIKDRGIFALAQVSEEKQIVITKWAQGIFDQYKSVIEKHPAKIKNSAELPFSKDDIQMAIKILLTVYVISDSSEMVDTLRDDYISTGAFQDIVPDDVEKILGEAAIIEPELESTDPSGYPIYHKYLEVIIAEQNALLEDVNNYIQELQQSKK